MGLQTRIINSIRRTVQVISLSETFSKTFKVWLCMSSLLAKTGLQLQYKQSGNSNPLYTMDGVKKTRVLIGLGEFVFEMR